MVVDVLLREALARDAIAAAARLRRSARLALREPVSIFDLVESLGIELRFAPLPSLEAMYSRAPRPLIVVSSLRPPGRQRYGCAHELGHHVFGHGMCIEDLRDAKSLDSHDEREFIAEVFAGGLLMPKNSVISALRRRQLTPQTLTPRDVFRLSVWYGVGYSTFVHHLRSGLRLATNSVAQPLLNTSVAAVKRELAGIRTPHHLVPIDQHWNERSVDVEVDDFVLSDERLTVQGRALRTREASDERTLLVATQPGLASVRAPNWSSLVRVSRRNYEGRGRYRHLEEVDEE